MARSGVQTTPGRFDGRWGRGLGRNVWLLAVVDAVAFVGLVGVASADPRLAAAAGLAAGAGSFVPGRAGRVAAVAAFGAAIGCALVAPSVRWLLVGVFVAALALLGRTVAAYLPSVRLLAAAVSPDRLTRGSVLLDERALLELSRARRYERPLSVIAVRIAGPGRRPGGEAVKAARALSGELRTTDIVGVTDEGAALAILPDTGRDAVNDLMVRLQRSVHGTGATGPIGFATFPDDGVTWLELKNTAVVTATPVAPVSEASEPLARGRALLEGDQNAG